MPLEPDSAPRFDPLFQSDAAGFDPVAMTACSRCLRNNPPDRCDCIYCGHALEIDPERHNVKVVLRELESWERGWNLIVRPASGHIDLAGIAALLAVDEESVRQAFATEMPIPLVRVENEAKAKVVAKKLATLGLNCLELSDDVLIGDRPPVRIRRIDIEDFRLRLQDFNTSAVAMIERSELALVVVGTLISRTTETTEKKRGSGTSVLDHTATSLDESVIDLYTRTDQIGYRAHVVGFDFSCLGPDKSLLATTNILRLAEVISEFAPAAVVNDQYERVRPFLDGVWKFDSRTDRKGSNRTGFGNRKYARVGSTNNLTQFTKFSRLQWHLL
ncbi:MAG: hypothetical protein AB7J13_01135 [Pyrinomonadaceae bacterium]